MHPQPRVRLSSWSMHTSIHSGGTGTIRHSPRNGFNGFLRALPGDEFLLPPSPHELTADREPGWADRASARLGTSNGCQDHTTSPSATLPLVRRVRIAHRFWPALRFRKFRARPCRVHRIPRSTSVTIAIRPSHRGGMREGSQRSRPRKSELFFARRLDYPNQFDLAREIRFLAQPVGIAWTALTGTPSRTFCPSGKSVDLRTLQPPASRASMAQGFCFGAALR
jgi:hypothetical protein